MAALEVGPLIQLFFTVLFVLPKYLGTLIMEQDPIVLHSVQTESKKDSVSPEIIRKDVTDGYGQSKTRAHWSA